MRFKKWRGSHNQKLMVFANGFEPDDAEGYPGPAIDVIVTGVDAGGWVTSVKGKPGLDAKQLKQFNEQVFEEAGVTPSDGFDALLKQADW